MSVSIFDSLDSSVPLTSISHTFNFVLLGFFKSAGISHAILSFKKNSYSYSKPFAFSIYIWNQFFILKNQCLLLLWLGLYTIKAQLVDSSSFCQSRNMKCIFSSVAQFCPTLCDPMDCSIPSLPVHQYSRNLLKLTSIESVMPSNHLILWHPLLLTHLIRVFSNESALCIRWPKYLSFTFSISPFNEYSGLVSFRIYWLDLIVVQGTLKSLLQHHTSKPSNLWNLAFFIVQLSHPYMTTGKTIALTRWTFFGKVISLLFNMLSRLVITFLPRSKCLLISWLQSPSAVILEPKITLLTRH